MLEKLKELALRYEDLQAQLADPSVYGDAERLKTCLLYTSPSPRD